MINCWVNSTLIRPKYSFDYVTLHVRKHNFKITHCLREIQLQCCWCHVYKCLTSFFSCIFFWLKFLLLKRKNIKYSIKIGFCFQNIQTWRPNKRKTSHLINFNSKSVERQDTKMNLQLILLIWCRYDRHERKFVYLLNK